ncbi:Translation initiation factor 2 [gamma proteobacterium IMCC2047]|nr:Translation initiation factor 2 [gamma proteobacterium IMCC2047]
MGEAGLKHSSADDAVSNEEKQTLLEFLKRSHGESNGAPKKITLNRKVTTQLKTGSSQGRGGKTVNVEVRKKRTYVKRSSLEAGKNAERLEQELERQAEAARIAAEEAARIAAEEARKKAEEEEAEKKRAAEEAARLQMEAEQAAKENESKKKKAETEADPVADEVEDEPAQPVELTEKERLHIEMEERKAAEAKKGKKAAPKPKPERWEEEVLEEESLAPVAGVQKRNLVTPKIAKPTKFLKQHGFAKPAAPVMKEVQIPESIVVSELAQRMSVKANVIIKQLMKMGVMANINQSIDRDTAVLLVEEMGHSYVLEDARDIEQSVVDELLEVSGDEVPRAPVVTVMGHVDHGKTSLLDYIRKSRVTAGESGGITQHIGAYHVETDHGMVCFLDTPGHAAFTAMRARGAQATDIVILVVAADDGVMPQTEEAIQHARSAGVPLVVAINKIDKEGADLDRVKNELAAKEVIPEDWGGDTQFIPVSAHTGEGIDELLDALLLQSEMLELTAAENVPARGVVVESRLDKGRGSVATLLIQHGTLKQGDIVLASQEYGRARALLDENAKPIKSAGPSIPVEILGLAGTPNAGDEFFVVPSEKKAREVAEFRAEQLKAEQQASQQAMQLENMFAEMTSGEVKVLNIVLKTDVRGTLEALTSSLMKIGNEEVKVVIVSSGVGGISETDANLAVSTGAVIFGFNVRADSSARRVIEKNGIDLRYYSVIYDIVDDVTKALSGMLSPEFKESIVGVAEVRDVFTSPKFGSIAGSMVIEGTVYRNKPIRVLRDDVVIYEGELESLRRFKDDANEVRNGMECGIGVKNYTDVRVGDNI